MKGKITLAGVLLTALIGTIQEAKCNVTLVLPQGITLQQIGFCNGSTGASQSFFYDYITNGNQISVPLHGRTRLHVTLKNGTISFFWENNVVDGTTYTIDQSAAIASTLATINSQVTQFQGEVTQLQSQITTLQNKLTTSGQTALQQITTLQSQNPSQQGQNSLQNILLSPQFQSQINPILNKQTTADRQGILQIIQFQWQIGLIQNRITQLQNQITALNQLS